MMVASVERSREEQARPGPRNGSSATLAARGAFRTTVRKSYHWAGRKTKGCRNSGSLLASRALSLASGELVVVSPRFGPRCSGLAVGSRSTPRIAETHPSARRGSLPLESWFIPEPPFASSPPACPRAPLALPSFRVSLLSRHSPWPLVLRGSGSVGLRKIFYHAARKLDFPPGNPGNSEPPHKGFQAPARHPSRGRCQASRPAHPRARTRAVEPASPPQTCWARPAYRLDPTASPIGGRPRNFKQLARLRLPSSATAAAARPRAWRALRMLALGLGLAGEESGAEYLRGRKERRYEPRTRSG